MKLEFSRQILGKKILKTKFNENILVGAELLRADEQFDSEAGKDEYNCRYSQFCEST